MKSKLEVRIENLEQAWKTEITNLRHENEALRTAFPKGKSAWWYETSPPALFGGSSTPKPTTLQLPECNEPCTANLEVRLEKLANYFLMRAKENRRRADREERKANGWQDIDLIVKHDRSGYYFDGKADSYERAAVKIREVLGIDNLKRSFKSYLHGKWIAPQPQVWITEFCDRRQLGTDDEEWYRSRDKGVCGEFSSEAAALRAIAQRRELRDSHHGSFLVRRARRIA